MFRLDITSQFKKDYKILSEADTKEVDKALVILATEGTLPYKPYLTHKLKGLYAGDMEAHIKPDLLIIWFEVTDESIKLVRVGSHARLFGKNKR